MTTNNNSMLNSQAVLYGRVADASTARLSTVRSAAKQPPAATPIPSAATSYSLLKGAEVETRAYYNGVTRANNRPHLKKRVCVLLSCGTPSRTS